MFVRKYFVTNSSSTGYVAWGAVLPSEYRGRDEDWEEKWPEGIEVHSTSDGAVFVCIEESVSYTGTDDVLDSLAINYGMHEPLKDERGWWYVPAKYWLPVEEPKDSASYRDWGNRILAYLNALEVKTLPKLTWYYHRDY